MSSHSEDIQCVDLLERTARDLQTLNALIQSAGILTPEHVTALQVLFMRRELIERAIESGTLSGEVAGLADRVAETLHDALPEMFYVFCHRLNVDAVISASDGTATDAASVFDSDGWQQVWWRLGAAARVGFGSNAPVASGPAQAARTPCADAVETHSENSRRDKTGQITESDVQLVRQQIKEYQRSYGADQWPNQAALAEKTRFGKSKVSKIVKQLTATGEWNGPARRRNK